MEQTTSAVIQPAHTLRLQVSPGGTTAKTRDPAQGSSYTWNAFLNDKPVFDKALDLPFARLPSRGRPPGPQPSTQGRYEDPSDARTLSELIFTPDVAIDASSPYVPVDIPSTLRSILEENDGYLRVQLRIGGADSEVHDLPWEYLALPWSDGGPLAADDRTPFARTIGRRAPGFRPLDVLPIRMLLVLEEALVEDPRAIEKPEKTRAVVGQAMDALSDLTARSPLHLTLLTGLGFAATDTHSSQIEIASISLSAFRTQLGQYQIAHFVPGLPAEHREEWSVQKGLRAFFGFDRKEEAEGVSVNTEDASVVPGFESLGMSLSAARRLPPFLVLPTEFARQGQSGQLVDFMGQGVAAILELPETATDRYWTGMQLFYNSLFEHGILDIAANQLRRFWLKNARTSSPQLPILWAAVDDGRLVARPAEPAVGPFAAGAAKAPTEEKTTSRAGDQTTPTPPQPDTGPAEKPEAEETPQQAAEPQQPAQPGPEAGQPDRAALADAEVKPPQEEAPTQRFGAIIMDASREEKPSQEEAPANALARS